jgi:hypothetical protein
MLALNPSTDPKLQQICRSVAQERFVFAIDFIQSLKPQHLSSFWYFASSQNFALIAVFGTLLLSTATRKEEEDFYKKKLREYRWILKINSENGARYMGPAMKLLDANVSLMNEGKSGSIDQPSVASSAPSTNQVAVPEIYYHHTPPNGNLSSVGSYTEESPMSNQQIHSADLASPGQFSYGTPYYMAQQADDGSSAQGHVEGGVISTQDFGYPVGMGNENWF